MQVKSFNNNWTNNWFKVDSIESIRKSEKDDGDCHENCDTIQICIGANIDMI